MLLRFFCSTLLILSSVITSRAQDGSQDLSFFPGSGFTDGEVRAVGVLSTGEVIAAGAFVQWDGNTVNRMVKLGTDGSLDFGFLANMGTGFDNTVNDIVIMSDDRIVAGGAFQNLNGNVRDRIVIINPDGTIDGNFDPLGGFSNEVLSVELDASEQILVGGYFTLFNSTPVGGLARLQQNGNLDFTFGSVGSGVSGGFPAVWDIEVQSDNYILIGGEFDDYDGNSSANLARLDPTGAFDPTFTVGTGVTGGATPVVYDIALNSAEAIIIGGEFTTYNGFPSPNIAMVDQFGGAVPSFAVGTGPDAGVKSIDITSDDYILAGGSFLTYDGNAAEFLVKVTPNGAYESSFNTVSGADGGVESLVINDNTSLYIGGTFQNYQGSSANRIAKINNSVIAPPPYIYVDWNASGANDGTSWNDAFNTLQDALAVAVSGDSVLVAEGTYTPSVISDNTESWDIPTGVKLFGGFTSGDNFTDRDSTRATKQTILSGEVQGDADSTNNTTRLFDLNGVSDIIIDGFVIEHAYTTTNGGVLYATATTLEFRNCHIQNNACATTGVSGAVLYLNSGKVDFYYCDINNNYGQNQTGGVLRFQGASNGGSFYQCDIHHNSYANNQLLFGGNNIIMESCNLYDNTARTAASLVRIDQGSGGTGTFVNCSFVNNGPGNGGGAISAYGDVFISSCEFIGNTANRGGAIWMQGTFGGQYTVTNSSFINNTATLTNGGAVYLIFMPNGTNSFINCTFAGNDGQDTNGEVFYMQGDNNAGNGNGILELDNCIIWGNGTAQAFDLVYDVTVVDQNTIIENGEQGGINADPLFNNLAAFDVSLTDCSPAIDAGSATHLTSDIYDLDNDGDISEPLPVDLNGNPRQFNTVDMGAYEFQSVPVPQTISISIAGSTLINPDYITLSQISNNKTDTTWVVYSNTGNCDLTIASANLDLNNQYTIAASWSPNTIAAGSSDSIPIIFNSSVSGTFYDTLTINSDATNDPVFTIFFDRTTVAPFITTWQSDNPGTSGNNQIIIPTTGGGYLYDIYWEEVGTPTNNGTLGSQTGDATITFPTPGTYRVEITGTFPRIFFNSTQDRQKILDLEQWGDITWTSLQNAFSGCTNLVVSATDAPNLAGTSSMEQMFQNATSFNADISSWDVSTITNMRSMFSGATSFNQDISGWDVSGVTDLSNMFDSASSFNQNLGNWNVGLVNNFSGMLDNSGLSVDNYDSTLIGWEALGGLQSGMTLGAVGLQYCNAATERSNIISTYVWTINDAGLNCVVCDTLEVTSTLDDGSCGTLRGAINYANSNPGTDTISFSSGASSSSIDLLSDLPPITEAVIIDGSSSPLWSDKPIIDIVSTAAVTGLDIQASGTQVNGLAFSDLNGVTNIIQITADSVVVDNCHFGVDTTGLVAGSNSVNAIQISNSTGNSIKNCLFARSTNLCIDLSNVSNTTIDKNIFGTSIQFDQTGGAWEPRVALALNSNCDSVTFSNNVIATTFNEAIAHYDSKHTIISNNKFGADTSGTLITGWGTSGSWLPMFNSDSCLVTNNIFLRATFNGIYLANSNSNVIQGNHFGVEADLTTTSSSHLSNNAVWISSSHSNQIGGLDPSEGNIITALSDGIRVESDSLNSFWSNIIYGCGGEAINIFTGEQENIQPPVVHLTGDSITTGTSSPNAFIQFYADTENQGRYLIDTLSADASGNWTYTLTSSQIASLTALGLDSLTALQDSSGNTSAFSKAIQLFIKTPLSWTQTDFTVLDEVVVNISLPSYIDDPSGILDTAQIIIISGPFGGAPALLDSTTGSLSMDFTQNSSGNTQDSIQIVICDIFGDCDTTFLRMNLVTASIQSPVVHNAISITEQDGLNDKVIIDHISGYPNSRFRVYNKWGTKLADITNYNNESNYWDGTYNGEPLPTGTYFYILWLNSSGKGKPESDGYLEIR